MSSFENTNYGQRPPTTMGQMNMFNGMPTMSQQQMQQKQQQQPQYTGMPQPPAITSNMSKFMPPSMAPIASTSSPLTSPTASSNLTTSVNGPVRPNGYQPPSSMASNLPPHMRPPLPNGPPASGMMINGGSANSSRTASPSLQMNQQPPAVALQQPQQQQQQQFKPMLSNPTATNSSALSATNISSINSSMQNLNINNLNGPSPMPILTASQQVMPPRMTVPPPASSQPQVVPSSFHNNFKTSALNAQPFAPQPNAIAAGPPSQNPTHLNAPTSSVYGTSTSPLMSYQQSQTQNANFPTAPNAAMRNNLGVGGLPPSNTIQQQNQLNNNQQQPQQPLQQQHQPPPPTTNQLGQQRKPMYPPSTQQLPPQQQQQLQTPQQQQQPYSAAYNYQQQQVSPNPLLTSPQPGMFNGQPTSRPLQYQSQTYAQQPQQQSQFPQANVIQQGFNRLWGQDTIDLMQNRHILSPATLQLPKIVLHNQFHESINCNPNIMRCTLAKIPESNSLLQKSRLPLGILIHPFRDINSLPVIQCPSIVRCRLCRTYINPFVYFVDSKMWKCNLCYRVNELPEDFQFDPATKTYGDVTRRPEVRSSTIEFIAPSEYMLRPPQPAIYLFLFDVSIIAQQCGYLENVCTMLSKHLDDMPGDARTQVGFIAYNSSVHFYSMAEGYNQPHEMTLLDIDEPFLPRPDNLLVNLKECKELVKDLLNQLPKRFADTHDPGSALGAALQVAYKLMQASGGRITVFQTCLPNKGPGSLEAREDPNNRSAKDVAHLTPATDFYKRYALECSGYQIAVDLFLLNQQYSDMATISGVSKHSGGCVHHFPLYQKTKPQLVDSLKHCLKRYLVRKIGFEAVMRIRCTRGLQVHTFHGNFFVRSTDLLSLPNVNPDAGYGMQISYEETLTDVKTICFQAALLYTNSEGERRIRVHTMCLPVTASLPEVMHAADTEAIIGLLSKMAVDRSIASNLTDAREAFLNATVDILNAFKIAQNLPSGQSGQLIAPRSLSLMPLYILALLKHPAFRIGTSTRLDDRVNAMDSMKTLPLDQLMKFIYPEFYNIDVLFFNNNANANNTADDDYEDYLPDVPRLQLSAEYLDSRSIFLMDCGTLIMIYVGINVPVNILETVFGIQSTSELPDYFYGLPNVNSTENDILKRFIMKLNDEKPYPPIVQIIRDTSTAKPQLIEKLVDDRSESSLSYYEFLQHIRSQVK